VVNHTHCKQVLGQVGFSPGNRGISGTHPGYNLHTPGGIANPKHPTRNDKNDNTNLTKNARKAS